jgi:hypothetical protein
VYVPLPTLAAGQAASVPATLKPGRWDVGLAYAWRAGVRVTAPGLDRTLPATLDRQGQIYPVGRITVRANGPTTFRVQAGKPRWNSPRVVLFSASLAITPVGTARTVPLKQACGKYLDWYRPANA